MIPNATAKMTTQFWSNAMEELSVSRTSGLTGYWSVQVSGYGPEADGTEESIDQAVTFRSGKRSKQRRLAADDAKSRESLQ